MRFSAITALCAAPLALAGTLQADLVARGAVDTELNVRTNHESSKSEGSSKGSNQVIHAGSSNAQVTEVIIIWINAGNNAATQTVGAFGGIAGAMPMSALEA